MSSSSHAELIQRELRMRALDGAKDSDAYLDAYASVHNRWGDKGLISAITTMLFRKQFEPANDTDRFFLQVDRNEYGKTYAQASKTGRAGYNPEFYQSKSYKQAPKDRGW